jgi:hypothetical protein
VSEFAPRVAEAETTPERVFWTDILNAFDTLTDVTDELDLHGEVEDLRDDTEEDALMKLYNYALMVSVDEGTSSKLEAVYALLRENNLIEIDG